MITMQTYSDFYAELKVFDLQQQMQVIESLLIVPMDDGPSGLFSWLNDYMILTTVGYDEPEYDRNTLVDLRTGELFPVPEIAIRVFRCWE